MSNLSISILNVEDISQFLTKIKEYEHKLHIINSNNLFDITIHFDVMDNKFVNNNGIDIEKIKEIFSKFEDANCIREIAEDKNGINVYVGSDSELSDEVSVVKTHYNIDGEEGTIAIIGPKRMEYDRVVSLLDYIKSNIGGDHEEE